jgi:hypothetical protein
VRRFFYDRIARAGTSHAIVGMGNEPACRCDDKRAIFTRGIERRGNMLEGTEDFPAAGGANGDGGQRSSRFDPLCRNSDNGSNARRLMISKDAFLASRSARG